jgi:hypothetical protein
MRLPHLDVSSKYVVARLALIIPVFPRRSTVVKKTGLFLQPAMA